MKQEYVITFHRHGEETFIVQAESPLEAFAKVCKTVKGKLKNVRYIAITTGMKKVTFVK